MKASAKLVWDPKDHEEKRPIKLRVTYNRQPRIYSAGTTIRLSQNEFLHQRTKNAIIAFDEARKKYNQALIIIDDLGDNFSFPAFHKQYYEVLKGRSKNKALFSTLVEEYLSQGFSHNTESLYHTAANKILNDAPDILIDDLNEIYVAELVRSMIDSDISLNSIRMYLRSLGAIFNYGIKRGFTRKKNPFKDINDFSLTSTRRENAVMSDEDLSSLLKYEPQTKLEEFGKDFFVLSLNLAGANIGDILDLKNGDIENHLIVFTRHKTKRAGIKVEIPISDTITNLLNKYGRIDSSKPKDHIFPYLEGKAEGAPRDNAIKRVNKRVNAGLKEICQKIGITKITTIMARHTEATYLRNQGMTVEQIQQFLGHSKSSTTELYLGTLNTETKQMFSKLMDKMMSQ